MSTTRPLIGVEIVDTPRGRALRSAGGVFLRLTGCPIPTDTLRRLARGHDHDTLDAASQRSWQSIVDALDTQHDREAPAAWPAERRITLVTGSALCGQLADDLRMLGADVTEVSPASALAHAEHAHPHLVVWLDDGVPPAELWSALDALPSHGIAWLRAHREGAHFWLDPIAVHPGDPLSAHVLGRRCAASPVQAELSAWLGSADHPTPTALSSLAARTIGLRVVATITAWAHDSDDLAHLRDTAWRFDTRTLASSEHPVLAYPQPAA